MKPRYKIGHQHRSGEIRFWSAKTYTEAEAKAECEGLNQVERGEVSVGGPHRNSGTDSGWRWIYRPVEEESEAA